MNLENQTPTLECSNYKSVIAAVSLAPETVATLQTDAGCDTCVYYGNNGCNANSTE